MATGLYLVVLPKEEDTSIIQWFLTSKAKCKICFSVKITHSPLSQHRHFLKLLSPSSEKASERPYASFPFSSLHLHAFFIWKTGSKKEHAFVESQPKHMRGPMPWRDIDIAWQVWVTQPGESQAFCARLPQERSTQLTLLQGLSNNHHFSFCTQACFLFWIPCPSLLHTASRCTWHLQPFPLLIMEIHVPSFGALEALFWDILPPFSLCILLKQQQVILLWAIMPGAFLGWIWGISLQPLMEKTERLVGISLFLTVCKFCFCIHGFAPFLCITSVNKGFCLDKIHHTGTSPTSIIGLKYLLLG